ncbi:MAG: hypothetical protein RSE41_06220, partial [Clostridia bacterium]
TAAYLDNNNTAGGGTALLNADLRYKDVYKVSDEEKSNKIQDTVLNNGTTLTQGVLYDSENTYNPVRKRLTNAIYTFMANNKGDGIYETIEDGNYSYRDTHQWKWIKNTDDTVGINSNWDSDYTLLGQTYFSFFTRGGGYIEGSYTGIWVVGCNRGYERDGYSFRPVLFGSTL